MDFLLNIPLLGTVIGWIVDGFGWIWDSIAGLF